MANIRIVRSDTVKPADVDAIQKGPLYMSAWDQIFGVVHVMSVHFYNPNPAIQVEAVRESLSQALVHFYPFAGRLRWAEDDSVHRRLEIDCNPMGCVLVEAECDEELSYFFNLPSEKLKALVPTVNYDSPVHEVPLLLVQLTKLRCGGLALGLAWAHSVADGLSAFHFFQEWARLAREGSIKEVPNLDRVVLRGRGSKDEPINLSKSDHIELTPLPLLMGKKDNSEERKKETVNMVLPLTKEQINTLKKAADSNYSRYQVVAAHIWRCACKAKHHNNEQPTTISLAVDVRNRIHSSPIPPRYFGNAFLIMRAISEAGEVISKPLGFACGKIKEAINKVNEDYIWSNIELLEKKEGLSFSSQDLTGEDAPFHGNPNLGVISWLTLPIYDMDFGWGDSICVRPITRDVDGHTLLLPGANGDGSIMVELCLQADHADEFKKYFYEDVNA